MMIDVQGDVGIRSREPSACCEVYEMGSIAGIDVGVAGQQRKPANERRGGGQHL
jgi:hypothetical protein